MEPGGKMFLEGSFRAGAQGFHLQIAFCLPFLLAMASFQNDSYNYGEQEHPAPDLLAIVPMPKFSACRVFPKQIPA